jgi:hypothetical protein
MSKVAGVVVALAMLCAHVRAQTEEIESIYAPPEILTDEQGVNEGGANLTLQFRYLSDYIFRGIDRSESGGTEDSPNLQLDGMLKFDLGKFPHLFLGSFTNIYDSDPLSRFQEIRPYFGLEMTARPVILTFGHSSYIYPDRDEFNTSEIWGRIKIDDSYFFRTDDPIFNLYLLAAWDYDQNLGLYFELGVSHDFKFEEIPLTLTPRAAIAYVEDNRGFRTEGAPPDDPAFSSGTTGEDSGFQHYEYGLEVTYALNDLFDIPARFGRLDFKGYLFVTDGIDDDLRADSELWGGVGIDFFY